MTQDEQDYIDDLQMTFATAGWRRMVEEAKAQIYQYQADALERCRTVEELYYMRGRAEQLAIMVNLPDTLKAMAAQAAHDEAEDPGEELEFHVEDAE